jgi:uncharacterized protein
MHLNSADNSADELDYALDADFSINPNEIGLWQAVEQFNQGEFYACHDTLEALWMEATPAVRPFYQGILQIAVAFYHLSRGNWRGAMILLGEGAQRLLAFEPSYANLDVENLIDQALAWLEALQILDPQPNGGAEQIAPLQIILIPGQTMCDPDDVSLAASFATQSVKKPKIRKRLLQNK